jgi:hypothetical protein
MRTIFVRLIFVLINLSENILTTKISRFTVFSLYTPFSLSPCLPLLPSVGTIKRSQLTAELVCSFKPLWFIITWQPPHHMHVT